MTYEFVIYEPHKNLNFSMLKKLNNKFLTCLFFVFLWLIGFHYFKKKKEKLILTKVFNTNNTIKQQMIKRIKISIQKEEN